MVKRVADLEGLVLGLLTLGSGYMFFQTFSYPRIPAEFPKLVSFVALVLCLVLLGGRLTGKLPGAQLKKSVGVGPAWWAYCLALLGYYAGILVAGLLPATFVFLLVIPIWVSGKMATWRIALIYAVVATAVLGAALKWVLQLPIPSGILFQ